MSNKLTEAHGHGAIRRLQTRSTISASSDTVWDALTDIEHVKRWWADGFIGKHVGEPVQLGESEELRGTIAVMMKPHIFEFTWHDEPSKSAHPEWIEVNTKSLVHFDLIEVDHDSTLLTLITFSPVAGAIGASAGWHHLFEVLKSYLETGAATSRPDRFDELKALYERNS